MEKSIAVILCLFAIASATVVAFTINSIRRSNKVQKELDASYDKLYERAMKALDEIGGGRDIKKMN